MNILVLTAMEEELLPIIEDYKVEKVDIKYDNNIYLNNEGKNDIYFSNTGICKVHAASSTTYLIGKINPDLVVNLGTAGGVNENLDILDLVIGDNLAYHDVDVTPFGYDYGQVPQREKYFKTNIDYNFIKNIESEGIKVHVGTILSGDQFINDKSKKISFSSDFENVYAVEMESTAIVDVCNRLNTKVIVIRGISDLTHGESTLEFDKYLVEVVKKFNKIIKVLKNYETI